MAYVVDERLAGSSARDPDGLVERLENSMRHSDFQGWIEDERRDYLAELEQAAKRASTRGSAEAAAEQHASPPLPAKPVEDLSALMEADRARYAEIDQTWSQKR